MSALTIAIAGNPNAGKTTLWNALTGGNAKVANYPGVTVERREARTRLPSSGEVRWVDLPGCYSLTARSAEEDVAHDVLLGRFGEQPSVVVAVVDATNSARGLYLAVQLIELGCRVVVALNMIDVADELGLHIDAEALAKRLGAPIVPISAKHKRGIGALVDAIESVAAGRSPGGSVQLPLNPDDLALARGLQVALPKGALDASLGEALWLLTSSAEQIATRRSASELALIDDFRARRKEHGGRTFGRRVIEARYRLIDEVLSGVVDASARRSDDVTQRLDAVLLHPVLGLVAFFVAMFVVFQSVFWWAAPFMDGVEAATGWLADGLAAGLPDGLARSLLINGLLAGVGNILVFLPQIALLFFLLTVLEESGYMARAAFLLDQAMRRVGLHGKAFLPLLSGFACAVPAVMAARTVESRRDRVVTILVTPFMSCSARLPVYVLVVSAVFSGAPAVFGWLSLGGLIVGAMYLLGFIAALATAWLLKRTVLSTPATPFIMELPPYKLPTFERVVREVLERCKVFAVQTGSIIMALSIVMWVLLTFPGDGLPLETLERERAAIAVSAVSSPERQVALEQLERRDDAERLSRSFAGRLGHFIEPAIEPLGFDWRIGIGLIASFAAREVLVSTLGQVFALGADVEPDSPALHGALLAADGAGPAFTPLVGVSLMVFFVLAMQCLSTVATVRRETNGWRWPLAQLAYMNGLAYAASLAVYQLGSAWGFG